MNSLRPIRVLVVDDSAFMRTAITRMIQSDAALQVVGTANDGRQALDKIKDLEPDVVTLDVEMPRMNGLETLQTIMRTAPRPVIMISSLTQEGAEMTFEALDAGAFDYIPKQLSYASLDIVTIREQLILKIKAASRSKLPALLTPAVTAVHSAVTSNMQHARPRPALICIGTSTGGPKALQQILPMLPGDLPTGVLVVQHMPPGFTGPFARRLDGLCKVRVCEAVNEQIVEPATVIIAPAGFQMTAYRRTATKFAVRVSTEPRNTLHIPSVDVMMLSAAEACRSLAMGVIMTGMGADGAHGMKAIHAAGGFTVGQDESSCAVYGMPRACAELGILDHVVPLLQIPTEIAAATSVINTRPLTVAR